MYESMGFILIKTTIGLKHKDIRWNASYLDLIIIHCIHVLTYTGGGAHKYVQLFFD